MLQNEDGQQTTATVATRFGLVLTPNSAKSLTSKKVVDDTVGWNESYFSIVVVEGEFQMSKVKRNSSLIGNCCCSTLARSAQKTIGFNTERD